MHHWVPVRHRVGRDEEGSEVLSLPATAAAEAAAVERVASLAHIVDASIISFVALCSECDGLFLLILRDKKQFSHFFDNCTGLKTFFFLVSCVVCCICKDFTFRAATAQ